MRSDLDKMNETPDQADIWTMLAALHERGDITWGVYEYSKERAELVEAHKRAKALIEHFNWTFPDGDFVRAAALAYRCCENVYSMAAAYLCDLILRDEAAGCCGKLNEFSIPGMYDLLEVRSDTTDNHLAIWCENIAHDMDAHMKALWELMIAAKLELL